MYRRDGIDDPGKAAIGACVITRSAAQFDCEFGRSFELPIAKP